jgi:hypothetical protein
MWLSQLKLLWIFSPRYLAESVWFTTRPWMVYSLWIGDFLFVAMSTSHLSGLNLINHSINKVEAVQRRATMFATGDYQCTSSVTAIATATPLADTTKQTSICPDSDDVLHSVQPCWHTSGAPPQPHLSSNQRPLCAGNLQWQTWRLDVVLPQPCWCCLFCWGSICWMHILG